MQNAHKMRVKKLKIHFLANNLGDIVLSFQLPNSYSVREIAPDIQTLKQENKQTDAHAQTHAPGKDFLLYLE